jgi:hypothetical protein
VVNVQSGLPVFASSACTIVPRPPSTTLPSAIAADEDDDENDPAR